MIQPVLGGWLIVALTAASAEKLDTLQVRRSSRTAARQCSSRVSVVVGT